MSFRRSTSIFHITISISWSPSVDVKIATALPLWFHNVAAMSDSFDTSAATWFTEEVVNYIPMGFGEPHKNVAVQRYLPRRITHTCSSRCITFPVQLTIQSGCALFKRLNILLDNAADHYGNQRKQHDWDHHAANRDRQPSNSQCLNKY